MANGEREPGSSPSSAIELPGEAGQAFPVQPTSQGCSCGEKENERAAGVLISAPAEKLGCESEISKCQMTSVWNSHFMPTYFYTLYCTFLEKWESVSKAKAWTHVC